MQRYMLTDEVFALINGSCNFYSAGTGEIPGCIAQFPMEKHKAFNVKKGVWHAHTLSEDAEVLIIEIKTRARKILPFIRLQMK